ncbi:3-oxoacyl-[acyl-carrier-protein] reductase [Candidatus Calditenuaceae archaeon HR02]|nr:3-oxoacyl-[acyl-carrier-protein] reductase [Candidatus Calditenuaceae archaeon HR02]
MVSDSLKGRVALVTGASRGIGAAIATKLGLSGAKVVCNYSKSEEAASKVVSRIVEWGGEAIAIRADISSKVEVEAMVEKAVKAFGRLDILVNNAGILIRGGVLDDISILDRVFEVNVKGVIYCIAASLKYMIKQRYGRIINIASIAAFGTTSRNTTYYAMTKGAIITLTKRLAFELGEYGITVNAVAPGFTKTDMTMNRPAEELQAAIRQLESITSLRRVGEPEDIAEVVAFLASDRAGFITGQVISVDGGRMDFFSRSA